MNVDLDKQDLISLVRGTNPNYNLMDHFLIRDYGYYNDLSGWEWNSIKLSEYSEEVLWDIYQRCKNQMK